MNIDEMWVCLVLILFIVFGFLMSDFISASSVDLSPLTKSFLHR